ncbi:unnamed protein product [marine sediment metagenome]|uniref:Uncharacterized protein n=1 Tax=marine sediment metagenome TaxID=412755 RepID=X1JM73_9ZZZZ
MIQNLLQKSISIPWDATEIDRELPMILVSGINYRVIPEGGARNNPGIITTES